MSINRQRHFHPNPGRRTQSLALGGALDRTSFGVGDLMGSALLALLPLVVLVVFVQLVQVVDILIIGVGSPG